MPAAGDGSCDLQRAAATFLSIVRVPLRKGVSGGADALCIRAAKGPLIFDPLSLRRRSKKGETKLCEGLPTVRAEEAASSNAKYSLAGREKDRGRSRGA